MKQLLQFHEVVKKVVELANQSSQFLVSRNLFITASSTVAEENSFSVARCAQSCPDPSSSTLSSHAFGDCVALYE